jgi:hypothetical protein
MSSLAWLDARPRARSRLIDGYAGPGAYEPDETGTTVDGSPIVALTIAEKAARWKSPRDIPVRLHRTRSRYPQPLAMRT